MASTTTTLSNGISTTSMFLTPQAVDDAYALLEGDPSIVFIDVMSNDLGGNAKTLFAIADGAETNLSADDIADLQTKDLAGVYEMTSLGASVAIIGGKIAYNTTAITGLINSLAENETRIDEITYAIRLGNGTLSLATLRVTITGTNDGPSAVADCASTDEDTAVTFAVLGNDSDPDASDTLSVTGAAITNGALGSVGVNGDNTLSYDPGTAYNYLAVNESATVEITYQVSDGHGGTASAVATVTVTGTNDGPSAVADSASTDEDTAVTFAVLGNDSDPDSSDVLSVTGAAITNGALGSVGVNGDNTLSYDPGTAYNYLAVNESATVEITYQVSDGHGGTTSAVATVTVTGTNDGPSAVADSASTDEDTAVTFAVLGNDSDPDSSDTLNVTGAAITNGALGSVSVNGDNTLSYDPGTAYDNLAAVECRTVEITYQVSDGHGGTTSAVATVTVNGVNDDPVLGSATADAVVSEGDDNPAARVANGTVSYTDVDNGDSHSFTKTDGTYGSVSVDGSGNWTYTVSDSGAVNALAAGEHLADSFTVTVADIYGGMATQTINVDIAGTNDGPVANADTASAGENETKHIDVLANDTDPDTNDTKSLVGADMAIIPTVVIASANPVINGIDATSAFTIDGGQIKFDPGTLFDALALGETALATVTYTMQDNHGVISQAQLQLTIDGANDLPVAVNDDGATDVTFRMLEDDSLASFDVRANDTFDADSGTSNSVSAGVATVAANALGIDAADLLIGVDASQHVTVQLVGTDWQKLAGSQTLDLSIAYGLHGDQPGDTSNATLTVRVTGDNDAPYATVVGPPAHLIEAAGSSAGVSTATATLQKGDVDGGTKLHYDTATMVTTGWTFSGNTATHAGLYGTVTLNFVSQGVAFPVGTDTMTYTLNNTLANGLAQGDVVTETFQLPVSDGYINGTSDVTFTIEGRNDAPAITQLAGATAGSAISVAENTAGSFITVTASDAESQALTYSIGANPDSSFDNGFFTVDPSTGALRFTSPPDFEFVDPGNDDLYKVRVNVTDTQSGMAYRDYFVHVTNVNEAPYATVVGPPAHLIEAAGSSAGVSTATATLQKGDVDGGTKLHYDTATMVTTGWTFSGNTATHAGLYGTVTLNFVSQGVAFPVGTDTMTYTLNNTLANGLAQGDVVTETFQLPVSDGYINGTSDVTFTIEGRNDAPAITQLAGATAGSAISVAENTAGSFITITASDAESQALTYSIGANPDSSFDNGFFTVDPSTGALRFTSPPDFEFADPGNDDLYKVRVNVTDTQGGTTFRDYFVKVTDVVEGISVQTVGYYEMSAGSGTSNLVAPISDAGLTAVNTFDFSAASLNAVDALFVTNSNNGGYGGEFLSGLSSISQFVYDGGVLVIHDRYVDNAEAILPGLAGVSIVRDFTGGTQVNFVNDTGQIAVGPGGTLTDASLDNGSYSNHGFTFSGTLPAGTELIQTTNDSSHVVTFAYHYGAGVVVYSSIPLDAYLNGATTGLSGAMEDYATNLLAWIKNGADFALA